jgi:beta-ketoacyl-acyl-carrier-protein synthase II
VNRVAVTGLGVLTSVGDSPDSFFNNLLAGKSGIAYLAEPFPYDTAARLASAVTFDPLQHFKKSQLIGLDRFSQLALVAARQAWANATLDGASYTPERTGVCWGTGLGGASTIEDGYYQEFYLRTGRVKPYAVFMTMCNAAAAHISLQYRLRGPTMTYSVACASSTIAIGEAFRLIRHGYADAMVAGGSEAFLTYGSYKAWEGLRALAVPDPDDPAASCRPFDRRRSGLVLGEGAAAVMLENYAQATARGAPILAEVVGYGLSTDAAHITAPDKDGQAIAMRAALADAGLLPDDIQHINAHGTATPIGDRTETEAIKDVFGDHARSLMISATKSMHGHVMGATGAVEFVAMVMALRRQAVPPTAHLMEPDPECDLDYVPVTARPVVDINCAMSNSFAFGGSNAVLVVKRSG